MRNDNFKTLIIPFIFRRTIGQSHEMQNYQFRGHPKKTSARVGGSRRSVHGGGGQKLAKSCGRLLWMAP